MREAKMPQSNGINIEVFDSFRITADDMNVIVHRKRIIDPTLAPNWAKAKAEGASPDKRVEWANPTFHATVEQALTKIAEQRMREADASTIEELLHEIRRIRRQISDVLTLRV